MLASGGTEIVALVHPPTADGHAGHALLLHDIPRTAGITAVSAHCVLHTYLGGPTAWPGRAQSLDAEQRRRLVPATAPARPAQQAVAPAHLDHVARILAGHHELDYVAAVTGPSNLVPEALCPDPSAAPLSH